MQYDADYASVFEKLYSETWGAKHAKNLSIIDELSHDRAGVWLDTFCGQGWHLARSGSHMQRVGIDRSPAQLAIARRRNPDCFFIEADLAATRLKEDCADLLTNFWASYCYLESEHCILQFFDDCCRAVRPGGALYWEIIEVDDVRSFNQSDFSRNTDFKVKNIDKYRWEYEDVAGLHRMISPPSEGLVAIAASHFRHVSCQHDSCFMSHLIARDA